MNLSDFFKQEDLLAFYHCPEFFRYRSLKQEKVETADEVSLDLYLSSLKKWLEQAITSEDAQFFGGDDEYSQVVLFSPSLRVTTNCFAIKGSSGSAEPVFFVRKLPDTVRDNHILIVCASILALRDLGIDSVKAWLTTGEQHLPVEPPPQNFEILERVSQMMRDGYYQVKTGRKCNFCPIKDTCEVYSEVERVKDACSEGPGRFYF